MLAGIGPPRRWAAPVAVVDVIRAAFGEVETYERATVRDVQPALVMGAVAADLAHLIAELLENALTFSPPEEKVEVRGRRRDDGSYTIAVVDAGYGMTEAELAQANRRLAGTESFTVAPSKYLTTWPGTWRPATASRSGCRPARAGHHRPGGPPAALLAPEAR